jgi:hypothetical protein
MIYETLNETTVVTWIGDLPVKRDGIKGLLKCTLTGLIEKRYLDWFSACFAATERQEYRMREVNA